jgi:hypothetical protein
MFPPVHGRQSDCGFITVSSSSLSARVFASSFRVRAIYLARNGGLESTTEKQKK